MKNNLLILVLTLTLISCATNIISKTNTYVEEIKNRKDLKESKTNGIINFSDSKDTLYRITSKTQIQNDSIINYDFYYKNEKFVFGKVLKLVKVNTKIDTITKSKIYFKNDVFIKQIDEKSGTINPEYIKILADVFTVRGLGVK